jgi:hypothetical protein
MRRVRGGQTLLGASTARAFDRTVDERERRVDVRVEEEQSSDAETNHWDGERVGYLVTEGAE